MRKKPLDLIKKDSGLLLEKITKRNRLVDFSISLFMAFLLTYALYKRITYNTHYVGDGIFINIFLVSYFLVAFIPLYRSVNLVTIKKTISAFEKYGITRALVLHYEELQIKSGWYLLHILLAMVVFILVFVIT